MVKGNSMFKSDSYFNLKIEKTNSFDVFNEQINFGVEVYRKSQNSDNVLTNTLVNWIFYIYHLILLNIIYKNEL
jgi:hypothetical protein